MTDKNKTDFEPEPLVPVLGNYTASPVHYSNKNEIAVDYSPKVKLAGVIIAILIILAFIAIYFSMIIF